jgi:trehalose-phosphatase
LIYAGNHGLEIAGPGLSPLVTEATQHVQELRARVERMMAAVVDLPGVWVEFKGLSASVHYREAADPAAAALEQLVSEVCHPQFRVTRGHFVYEVRPPVDWHKGTAARWIIDQQARCAALSVAAGDDSTDEDLFRALPEGITIRVGNSVPTAARYHVAGQDELVRFLAWLAQHRAIPTPVSA